MAIEKFKPDFQFDEERIKKLYEIAPEAFADGKVNWLSLQEALGTFKEDDDVDSEHFGLFWPGKREARKLSSFPSKKTLFQNLKKGVDNKNTRNIFIEGENLDVLKVLQKSYTNRIKVIYIDPPYNTGKDFVYDDNFIETKEEFLARTGQLTEDYKPTSANTKADGRFHSKWLSLMYPRLRLARNLLREDGVIFISIDDNEINNLKSICNEIFGEENFLAQLIWRSGRTSSGHYTSEHEYILAYVKTKDGFKYFDFVGDATVSDRAIKRPSRKNPVSDISFPRGIEFLGENKIFPKKFGSGETVEVIEGVLECENGILKNDVTLRCAWTMKDQIEKWLRGEEVTDQKGQTVEKFFFKSNGVLQYQKKKGTFHPKSIIEGVSTKNGSNEIIELFGEKVFDFPKPTKLLVDLITPVLQNNDGICLDFFAGSGSFGDAIYQYNLLNNTASSSFILVQIPELLSEKDDSGKIGIKLGFKNIAEITSERLSRVAKKIKGTSKDDLGFKYFKLSDSNFKSWQDYSGTNLTDLEKLFENNLEPLVENWEIKNLISELMLIEGFPLDSAVSEYKTVGDNNIFKISSDFCEHNLHICLDKELHLDTIKTIALDEKDIFICLDSAISDKDKAILSDKGLIKTI